MVRQSQVVDDHWAALGGRYVSPHGHRFPALEGRPLIKLAAIVLSTDFFLSGGGGFICYIKK